jgi:thiol-disulfide isomerase/thioredoxin
MPVSRINRRNLDQILGGKVDGEHEVVIKLYGSNCHLCHALKPKFVDISDEYEGVHFYAFNMEEGNETWFDPTGIRIFIDKNRG